MPLDSPTPAYNTLQDQSSDGWPRITSILYGSGRAEIASKALPSGPIELGPSRGQPCAHLGQTGTAMAPSLCPAASRSRLKQPADSGALMLHLNVEVLLLSLLAS